MAKARRKVRKQVVRSLKKRSPEPTRTTPPTQLGEEEARAEGARWVTRWVPVGPSRRRLTYIKTTPEREATTRILEEGRRKDFGLAEPWVLDGSESRYRGIFRTSEGRDFVRRLENIVKANAAKGKRGKTTHLMDIGAGLAQYWGPVLERLRKHGKVKLHVLNLSRVGKESSPADYWHIGAIETKGFGRRKFDGVLCAYGGFDRSDHPIETLQKMIRLTKPGGVQYILFGRALSYRRRAGEELPLTRSRIERVIASVDPEAEMVRWREPGTLAKILRMKHRNEFMLVRGGELR